MESLAIEKNIYRKQPSKTKPVWGLAYASPALFWDQLFTFEGSLSVLIVLFCPNPKPDASSTLAMFWCKHHHFLSVSSALELDVTFNLLCIGLNQFLALFVDF